MLQQKNTVLLNRIKYLFLALILYDMGSIGITAGAHRLWSHRSYSANLPLQLILFIFYSSTAGVKINLKKINLILLHALLYSNIELIKGSI
jgi:fatty-acid desaturase